MIHFHCPGRYLVDAIIPHAGKSHPDVEVESGIAKCFVAALEKSGMDLPLVEKFST